MICKYLKKSNFPSIKSKTNRFLNSHRPGGLRPDLRLPPGGSCVLREQAQRGGFLRRERPRGLRCGRAAEGEGPYRKDGTLSFLVSTLSNIAVTDPQSTIIRNENMVFKSRKRSLDIVSIGTNADSGQRSVKVLSKFLAKIEKH